MKYSAIKRFVLELINQSTIAGDTVSPTYNNQQDYLLRIPNLMNAAVTDIRARYPQKDAVHHTLSASGAVTLPAKVRSGNVRRIVDGIPEPYNRYRILGGRVWLPAGEYVIEYDKNPEQLPDWPETHVPPDDYDFQEDNDVIQAACYYAAAGLVQMEDEFTYTALMTEYNRRLAAMIPPPVAEFTDIQDVYGGGCF